jgi:hypothetical protein
VFGKEKRGGHTAQASTWPDRTNHSRYSGTCIALTNIPEAASDSRPRATSSLAIRDASGLTARPTAEPRSISRSMTVPSILST